ncbi:permease of the major facilitator superfamily [Corynebacterium striatum]|uniref:MFS transporter n=1 Tax=Corynebacterium striatum TaxID=43770 RepID=UPI000DF9BA91|nr:MFS transporter [Corynebacterium striatum]STD38403.1 permease of the major facilitator superfamily [Corynebacterium striatum]
MDIRKLVDSSPMGLRQWSIIFIALYLNALDGYDTVAMAFGAGQVTEAFTLSDVQLGWLLSAALIGIGLGSLFLAPTADRVGRTRLITISLFIDLVGLVATVFAPTFALLFIFRVLTGIGVGGVLVCVTVLVSEYSNLRFRGLAVAIYASGYGLGASLCGVIASAVAPSYGWQAIFWVGAGLTVVAIALTVLFVPESADFLAARGRMDKVRFIAAKLGLKGEVTVRATKDEEPRAPFKDILSPSFVRTTIKLWLAFSFVMFAYNFTSQWTPKLLTEEGLTAQQGVIGGIMLSFGGTIGALIFGFLTTKIDARPLLIVSCLVASGVLVGFIFSTSIPTLMFSLGVGVGLTLNACITGLYTVAPESYPSALRTTGTGAAIGIARMGATLAPILTGYLLSSGWTPTGLYTLAGATALLAALSLFGVRAYSAKIADEAPASTPADAALSDAPLTSRV